MSEVVAELLCTVAVVTRPSEKLAASLRNRTRLNRPSRRSSTAPRMIRIIWESAKNSTPRAISRSGISCVISPVKKSVRGSTASFSGLARCIPPTPSKTPSRNCAVRCTGWNHISSGSSVAAAKTLKKSWTVEAAKARSNSWERVTWPIDTIVFVIVVPMLAPMMIGMATEMLSAPEATRPTTIVVVVEELWIRLVARNPMMSPARGSDAVDTNCSAKPRPAILKAALIRSMEKKKR